jgi:hypothetical protein
MDPATGQVLSPAGVGPDQLQAMQNWQGGAVAIQMHAGQVVSMGGRPVQIMGHQGLQYIAVQSPHGMAGHPIALPPGMQLVHSLSPNGADSPSRARQPVKRKRPPPKSEPHSFGQPAPP